MSRHNGINSIKINVTCHRTRYSHEGPEENKKNPVLCIRPEPITSHLTLCVPCIILQCVNDQRDAQSL